MHLPRAVIRLALVAAAVLVTGAALRAVPTARAASSPVAYLLGAQNSDGGFGDAAGQPSSQLYAGWAALGLASAGYRLSDVSHGGPSVIDYVRAGAGASDPGSVERTILVVSAAGDSPRAVGGRDLIAELEGDLGRDGAVEDEVNLTSFAILALRGAGIAPAARTVAWLERQQDRDGGYNYAGAGGTSDVDDTGAALEALAASGGPAAAVRTRAVTYLRRQQDRDGGFPAQPGAGSNAQSTAWAIQGLDASGVSPDTLHRDGAPSPLAYLRSLVGADGQIAYTRGNHQTPVWVTGEALMALEGKPLPLAPQTPAPAPSVPGHHARAAAPNGRAPAHHRVAHRTHVRVRRAAALRPARISRPGTGMQSVRLCEAMGVLTGVLLAPVDAG